MPLCESCRHGFTDPLTCSECTREFVCSDAAKERHHPCKTRRSVESKSWTQMSHHHHGTISLCCSCCSLGVTLCLFYIVIRTKQNRKQESYQPIMWDSNSAGTLWSIKKFKEHFTIVRKPGVPHLYQSCFVSRAIIFLLKNQIKQETI